MKRGLDYLHSGEKRALDLAGALVLDTMAIPACLASSAVLAAELKLGAGDIVLPQLRHGVNGLFATLKLRTLPMSDRPIVTHGTFDPRAGRLGKYIRQMGLDEIPQFVNVIQGDMSLVGPRPLITSDFDKYCDIDPVLFDEWKAMYDEVKPGMFGPSQILKHSNRYMTDDIRREAMALDIRYAETATLGGDIGIIAKTPVDLVMASIAALRQPVMDLSQLMGATVEG